MENYFNMNLTKQDIDAISNLGLAHMGDCVFEILCRGYLCARGGKNVGNLHRDTINMVKACSVSAASLILTWINLKPENTLEEHYFGIQTKTADGDYINQWVASVGNHLTAEEIGYRWCFIYNRDTEQPFGMRVCWRKAEYYQSPHHDPILPTTKLVLPPAEEVETIHVEQQEKEQNKTLMKQMFSAINATIQKRAKDGFDHAFIPWSSLGNSREMQSLFFQEAEAALLPESRPWILPGRC